MATEVGTGFHIIGLDLNRLPEVCHRLVDASASCRAVPRLLRASLPDVDLVPMGDRPPVHEDGGVGVDGEAAGRSVNKAEIDQLGMVAGELVVAQLHAASLGPQAGPRPQRASPIQAREVPM